MSTLERLSALRTARKEIAQEIDALVAQGRSEGLTWTELARVLGVSPQAVQKRYGTGAIGRSKT